jgi:hypothetical protein
VTVSNHILPTPLDPVFESAPADESAGVSRAGILIINADDWGRDSETTNRILECALRGSVSSASAMVFMEDSERAADLAREHGVDVGLHLNFTTPFSASMKSQALADHHARVSRFLLRSPLCKVLYHPALANSFAYLVAAQLEEFQRIFGVCPRRVDGHHHMHLCANVLFGGLLPAGTIARRNFSFQPGEKSGANRFYRGVIDRVLARRHQLTDFFFSLPPLEPTERLERIFGTAARAVVELETHPVNPDERRFLLEDGVLRLAREFPIARRFTLQRKGSQVQ